MANLRIRVNGKFYDITCDKNNEKYVLELSSPVWIYEDLISQIALFLEVFCNVIPCWLLQYIPCTRLLPTAEVQVIVIWPFPGIAITLVG